MNEPGVENATPPGLEPSGFADLYHEHSKAVYYLALRYLGDPQRAEDVTHDVFLKWMEEAVDLCRERPCFGLALALAERLFAQRGEIRPSSGALGFRN